MSDDRALLIAIPERHLESLSALVEGPTVLPAGGVGDLDAASTGMSVFVMATDVEQGDVPAATWRATFLARVPYEPGAPWPEGLPPTWVEEHEPVDGEDDAVLAETRTTRTTRTTTSGPRRSWRSRAWSGCLATPGCSPTSWSASRPAAAGASARVSRRWSTYPTDQGSPTEGAPRTPGCVGVSGGAGRARRSPPRRTTQASVMWVNIAAAAPSGSWAAIRR